MKQRYISLILSLGLLCATVILLAGCGSASAKEKAAPTSTATAVATATPRPTPTATPVGARAVAPKSLPNKSLAPTPTPQSPSSPSRLVLPSIDVDIPVVELGWSSKQDDAGRIFSEWDVANFAAGWHKNSVRPDQPGNVVLSGHNNIKGAVFRQLDQLQRGDQATLYVGDKAYVYAVDAVMIVPEKNATPEQRRKNVQWILSTDDNRLTLVSCWPRNDNTHRIIVVAHPVTP